MSGSRDCRHSPKTKQNDDQGPPPMADDGKMCSLYWAAEKELHLKLPLSRNQVTYCISILWQLELEYVCIVNHMVSELWQLNLSSLTATQFTLPQETSRYGKEVLAHFQPATEGVRRKSHGPGSYVTHTHTYIYIHIDVGMYICTLYIPISVYIQSHFC